MAVRNVYYFFFSFKKMPQNKKVQETRKKPSVKKTPNKKIQESHKKPSVKKAQKKKKKLIYLSSIPEPGQAL